MKKLIFAVADTFTDSLARLTVEEQKAVKISAFDLQMNQANPGARLHRVYKTKDPDFWSARATGKVRLIVHRTQSSMLLCYVDHHDPAYDWARCRKLETHPETGSAQFVELRETVREITVPRYTEVERPALRKASMFAHVTERELLSYGVPPQWLPEVRRVVDEETLLDLAEYLPAEAGEALVDLAIGRQPKVIPALVFGAAPFRQPDAHLQFRVMQNVEDLERALGNYVRDKQGPASAESQRPQSSATGRKPTVPDMTVQIDDEFIRKWYPQYDLIADDEPEYERLVATVAREMKSMATISKKTFLDIWNWKGAMRVIGLTTIYVEGQKTRARSAAEDEYETRYATAFRRAAVEPPERKLGALLGPSVKLPGVGAPTGSTLIHFIHPQTIPIIDRRTAGVLFAFGCIATAECWLETYQEFRGAINKIRRDCPGWTLRQIDRALFAYHKKVLDTNGAKPSVPEIATSDRKPALQEGAIKRAHLESAQAVAPVCWLAGSTTTNTGGAEPLFAEASGDQKIQISKISGGQVSSRLEQHHAIVESPDMLIRCVVTPQGKILADGLEAVELYVLREFEALIQKPPPNQRIDVRVLTATGAYAGGLRTNPPSGEVYLCPDLKRDGRKVSLAKVLKENGIEPRAEINVRIEGGFWKIVAV